MVGWRLLRRRRRRSSERLAKEDQLAGSRRTHSPAQRRGEAGVAGQADLGERSAEPGGPCDHAEVAGEGKAQAGADAGAVDRRDHRFGHGGEQGDDRVVVLVDRGERGVGIGAQGFGVFGEVLSDAERLPGAGEHHRAHGVVRGHRGEFVAQVVLDSGGQAGCLSVTVATVLIG